MGEIYKVTVEQVSHCLCEACKDGVIHWNDCSVHNQPAYLNGKCDCGIVNNGDITVSPESTFNKDRNNENLQDMQALADAKGK